MAKHRLDRRKKRIWGGPALLSMIESPAPGRHAAEDGDSTAAAGSDLAEAPAAERRTG